MSDTFELADKTYELAGEVPPPRPNAAQERDDALELQRQRATDDLLRQLQAVQGGNAGHREDGVELWAHCPNVNKGCDDKQERVTGSRLTFARTYRDGGDNGPNSDRVERSWTEYAFMSEADRLCPKCGTDRVIGEQERPVYQNENGFDQRALLKMAREWTNGGAKLGDGVIVQTAQQAAQTPQTPLDALGFRLANGTIEVEEYARLRAALEGDTPPADTKLPEGVRRRGDRFQARLNKSETPDGEPERILGTFDTIEECQAARAEALGDAA